MKSTMNEIDATSAIMELMKQVLIIGSNSTDMGEVEMMARYREFFDVGASEVTFTGLHFDQLGIILSESEFSIIDTVHNKELNEYDLIAFRGKVRLNVEMAYCVSRYALIHNVTFFNDYSPYGSFSKVVQSVAFFELGVPFIKTLYSTRTSEFHKLITKHLSTPFIVKDSYGSHGADNYLLENLPALRQLNLSTDKRYVAQDYFENKCDYRILCIGNEELIIRRTAKGSTHLNNTSMGATADLVEGQFLPPIAIKQAHKIADTLKMGIAGVDLLYNEKTGVYKFLEINSQPQLTSGAFVPQKQQLLHRYLRKKLSISSDKDSKP